MKENQTNVTCFLCFCKPADSKATATLGETAAAADDNATRFRNYGEGAL